MGVIVGHCLWCINLRRYIQSVSTPGENSLTSVVYSVVENCQYSTNWKRANVTDSTYTYI